MTDHERTELKFYIERTREKYLDPNHAFQQLEFVYEWYLKEGWVESVGDFLANQHTPQADLERRKQANLNFTSKEF